MKVRRDDIFAALFAQVANFIPAGEAQSPFVYSSRKFQDWTEVGPANQPALFMTEEAQVATQTGHKGITSWILHARFWIYCQHSPDQGSIPSSLLNSLMDTVDDALAPSPGQFQTLGGLVAACYFEGDVILEEGRLPNDTQGIAVMPVKIVCLS